MASGPAGATVTGASIICSTATGSQESPTSLFSCSDSDATGGAGTIQGNPPKAAYPFFTGTRTGTIYWSGATTTVPVQTVIKVRTQVVKRKNTPCLSDTELKVGGTVRSDTSGAAEVGGRVSAILCQGANGSFSLLSGTSFVIG
jgi:hypothetical protein